MRRNAVYLMMLSMVLALVLPTAIRASGCRAVVVQKRAVVVQEKVAVVQAAALVVPLIAQYAVPLYGATYTPPPQQQNAADDLSASVKALAEQVRQLTERINQPPTMQPADNGGHGKPPDKPKPIDPFAPVPPQGQAKAVFAEHFVVTKCASCHDESKAAAHGGKLVLSSGDKMKQLSAEELGKVLSEVSSGRMPKGGKMAQDERLLMISELLKQP